MADTIVLPEKTWTESLSVEKVSALFSELEFRTLSARLKEVVSGVSQKDKKGEKGGSEKEAAPEIPEAEFRPVSIALWLINSEINNPKLDDILNFARTDSFEKAKEVILAELKKRNLEKVFNEIEIPLIPVVAKMHDDGIKVDVKFLKDLSVKYHKQLSEYEESIWEMAGENFNINSPKQLGVILFDKLGLAPKNQKKTAGGAKSTKESELEKLREVHPIIEKILEYRELQKLLSTYIDAIPKSVAEDGRLHATFLQAGAATGRMASHDPNLQNIPIKSALGQQIRHAFIAEKGNSLVAIDYSQIELRIAAFLSGDEKLIEIFKRGEDVHTAVAAQVFKVSEKDVTKEMRRQAKVINFGILYGMGVNALRANLGTDRATAQNFYNEYFSNFSGLASYLDKVKADTERIGYTETFFGRRRYFAGIKSKLPFIRAMAERMAINAPIQGTEADIVKIAMVQISKYIFDNELGDEVKLLLQVHDELVFEIKTESVKKVVPELQKIMEDVIDPKEISGIVCKAESSVGNNWGSMEDLTS